MKLNILEYYNKYNVPILIVATAYTRHKIKDNLIAQINRRGMR